EALDDKLRLRHAEQLQLIAEIDRLVAAIILLRREARDRPLTDEEITVVDRLARDLGHILSDLRRVSVHDRPLPPLPEGIPVR
ncbi:hypothetical protein ABTF85_19435, partial [Acinetobacter baumannii]